MGIFSKIMAKIFPSDHPAVTSPTPAPPATPAATPASASAPASTAPGATATAAAGTTGTSAPAMPPVDVEAILKDLSAKNPGPSNWRTSIVDLMKLLGLDSDLASRKELAKELGYTGDTADSATMNVWLHKQVMTKLAANGGKVPADLRD